MSGERASFRRRQSLFRRVVLAVVLTFFTRPLLASLEFTLQGPGGTGHQLTTWTTLMDFGACLLYTSRCV